MGVGFDVWLMSFSPDAQDPEGALADAFGLDRRRARRLIDSLPKVVKRGVAQAAAQQYAGALRELGARVEVRATRTTDAYAPASLPRITGFDPSEDEATMAELSKPTRSGSSSSAGSPSTTRRATLGDGPEGTRDVKLGEIVGGGDAPYAWLTYSLMSWIMFAGGAAILSLQLSVSTNPFAEPVELPGLLIGWIGGTLATAGLIEGIHGALKRRELKVRLPVAVLWLALLVGVQLFLGSSLFSI